MRRFGDDKRLTEEGYFAVYFATMRCILPFCTVFCHFALYHATLCFAICCILPFVLYFAPLHWLLPLYFAFCQYAPCFANLCCILPICTVFATLGSIVSICDLSQFAVFCPYVMYFAPSNCILPLYVVACHFKYFRRTRIFPHFINF